MGKEEKAITPDSYVVPTYESVSYHSGRQHTELSAGMYKSDDGRVHIFFAEEGKQDV